jgi:hypothetical protein
MITIDWGRHISCVTLITSMRAHVSVLRDFVCMHSWNKSSLARDQVKLCRPRAPFPATYMNKSQLQLHRCHSLFFSFLNSSFSSALAGDFEAARLGEVSDVLKGPALEDGGGEERTCVSANGHTELSSKPTVAPWRSLCIWDAHLERVDQRGKIRHAVTCRHFGAPPMLACRSI